jgi:hypothetical protein
MRKLPDWFLFGILIAILCLGISYFLLYILRLAFVNYYGNPYVFAEPRIQLIAMLINVVLFRVVVVNFKKEKTGRGILFTTVILTFLYLVLYSRYNFRMTPVKIPSEIESKEMRI